MAARSLLSANKSLLIRLSFGIVKHESCWSGNCWANCSAALRSKVGLRARNGSDGFNWNAQEGHALQHFRNLWVLACIALHVDFPLFMESWFRRVLERDEPGGSSSTIPICDPFYCRKTRWHVLGKSRLLTTLREIESNRLVSEACLAVVFTSGFFSWRIFSKWMLVVSCMAARERGNRFSWGAYGTAFVLKSFIKGYQSSRAKSFTFNKN